MVVDGLRSSDSRRPAILTALSRRRVLALAGRGAIALAAGGVPAFTEERGGVRRADAGPAPGLGPVEGEIAFSWWGTGERSRKTQAVMALFQQKYPKAQLNGQPVGDFNTYFDYEWASDFMTQASPEFALRCGCV